MTLILGVEDAAADRSFLFGDRGITRGQDTNASLARSKIWRTNGWLVGVSGGYEMLQAVQRIPLPNWVGEQQTEDCIADALNDWQELLYKRCTEITTLFHGVDATMTGDTPKVIVARGKFVFRLAEMAVIRTTNGWHAVGCWSVADGAVAALQQLPGLFAPFEIGRRATLAAASVTDGIRGPFDWLCTDATQGTFE